MPKKQSSVTIFVPVKNAEATIKQCIESLLNQTYKKRKIFVIENMSTDKTYEILKQFKRKIRLERMGGETTEGSVPKMHNYVLDNVSTDFIAYTNADCVVKKDWLEKLLSGFTSPDVIATAGFCGTPKGLNRLQTLIGVELENRFKKFPKFISRAPDMNLCVRTEVAKKVRFDERFIWSWESDFGYRLTKEGKMKYVPEAVVYHYHRPTWKGFFKQQFNNARVKPLLYWKHRNKMKGDHISTPTMALMLLLSYLSVFFLVLFFLDRIFILPLIFSILLCDLVFLVEILKLSRKISEIPTVIAILFVRTVAWVVGIPFGLILFLKRKWYR